METKQRNLEIIATESELKKVVLSAINDGIMPTYVEGQNTLLWAAKHSYYAIAVNLLDHGVTPSFEHLEAAIDSKSVGLIKRLISAGVDVTAENNKALLIASSNGDVEITELLIMAGANASANNSEALIQAVINKHTEIAEMLISAGADPSASKYRAFKIAAGNNDVKTLNVLLNANIDLAQLLIDAYAIVI